MARYGMAIDLKRCIACMACMMACKAEHSTPSEVFWSGLMQKETGEYPYVETIFLRMLCNHCRDALCVRVCPSGATSQREDGIVTLDSTKCLGCRACITACPYQARYYIDKERSYFPPEINIEEYGYQKHEKGLVGKCNFCLERLEKGLEPACVVSCISGARTFGDLDDPESEVSRLISPRSGFQIHPELGTDPSVYYLK